MKHRKKLVTSLFAVAGLLLAGSVWADGKGAGIAGSPHDFTDNLSSEAGGAVLETGTGGWNGRNEICRVCHVPHDHARATQYYLNGLLWNHGVSAATYTMYNSSWSSTLTGAQPAQPDGVAKLCLGCHDGTVAVDTFDKYTGTVAGPIQTMYGGALAGFRVVGNFMDGGNLDMRGTHPLSITYDTADTGLRATTQAQATSGRSTSCSRSSTMSCGASRP